MSMEKNQIAIEVLRDIALDGSLMVSERQRAIDALTIFKASSMEALEFIRRRTDLQILKERANLYVSRIKAGTITNLQA